MSGYGQRVVVSIAILCGVFVLGRVVLTHIAPSLGALFLFLSPVLFGQFAPLAFIRWSKGWRPLPLGSAEQLAWNEDRAAPRTVEGTLLCLIAGLALYAALFASARIGLWPDQMLVSQSGGAFVDHPRFFIIILTVVACAVGTDIASHAIYYRIPRKIRRAAATVLWNLDTIIGAIGGLYLGVALVGAGPLGVNVEEWLIVVALYVVVHAQVNLWLNWNKTVGLKTYAAGEQG